MRSGWRRAVVCCWTVGAIIVALALIHAGRVEGARRVGSGDGMDEMGGHMTMTKLRSIQPGDQARADAIVASARRVADRYTDYRKALADGYTIFMPEQPQHVYHFTLNEAAMEAVFKFDADKPTSLLYEKTAAGADGKTGYKLVGVMYTDRFGASEAELDSRVPLSVARWHLHTNLCLPPRGEEVDWKDKHAKFGLQGSITTAEACRAAGGRFMPHLFGWMVHVYPYETDTAKIWAAGMDDEHSMDKDGMAGMKMEPR